MVDPIELSRFRLPQTPRPQPTAEGTGPAGPPGVGAGEVDVVAPGLIDRLDGADPGFDPIALAESAGKALSRTELSIGNARPETVAAFQR